MITVIIYILYYAYLKKRSSDLTRPRHALVGNTLYQGNANLRWRPYLNKSAFDCIISEATAGVLMSRAPMRVSKHVNDEAGNQN